MLGAHCAPLKTLLAHHEPSELQGLADALPSILAKPPPATQTDFLNAPAARLQTRQRLGSTSQPPGPPTTSGKSERENDSSWLGSWLQRTSVKSAAAKLAGDLRTAATTAVDDFTGGGASAPSHNRRATRPMPPPNLPGKNSPIRASGTEGEYRVSPGRTKQRLKPSENNERKQSVGKEWLVQVSDIMD